MNSREVHIFTVKPGNKAGEEYVDDEYPQQNALRMETLSATLVKLGKLGWTRSGQCKLYNDREIPIWQDSATGQRVAVCEYIEWMIWIDLEGFSYIFRDSGEGKALWGVRCLMGDLFRVGGVIWPSEQERLFMHQVGDGFIIKPDFGDIDLLRPLAIGTALLRASLMRGYCLKVGVGLGGLADVTGCYPREITDGMDGHCVSMGAGLMTVFPVMGDGLIDSHAVSCKASGPLLVVRKDLADATPAEEFITLQYRSHFEVDWIHSTSCEADRIMRVLGGGATPDKLQEALKNYLSQHGCIKDEWRKSAELMLRGYQ